MNKEYKLHKDDGSVPKLHHYVHSRFIRNNFCLQTYLMSEFLQDLEFAILLSFPKFNYFLLINLY